MSQSKQYLCAIALLAMGAAHAQSINKADQKLLKDLAVANQAEVEAGQMALQKSKNEQVRSFAQKMVDDHSKGLEEVRKVAASKNVTLPAELDSKHKALANKLQAKSGDQFDRAYMDQAGVKSHQEASKLITKVKSARDSDVMALAGKLEPTIHQHAQQAQQLSAGIKGKTPMDTSGGSGTEGPQPKSKPGMESGKSTSQPQPPVKE